MFVEFIRYGCFVMKFFETVVALNDFIEEVKCNSDIKIIKIFSDYKKEK